MGQPKLDMSDLTETLLFYVLQYIAKVSYHPLASCESCHALCDSCSTEHDSHSVQCPKNCNYHGQIFSHKYKLRGLSLVPKKSTFELGVIVIQGKSKQSWAVIKDSLCTLRFSSLFVYTHQLACWPVSKVIMAGNFQAFPHSWPLSPILYRQTPLIQTLKGP